MNSLSWFLYAADVIPKISYFLFISCSAVLMFGGFVASYRVIEHGDKKAPYIIVGIVCAVFILLSLLTPSKNTMYAIAASELGQKAVESEIGGKALKAIEQWIESQVKK